MIEIGMIVLCKMSRSRTQVTRFDKVIKGSSNFCQPFSTQVLDDDSVFDIHRRLSDISKKPKQHFKNISLTLHRISLTLHEHSISKAIGYILVEEPKLGPVRTAANLFKESASKPSSRNWAARPKG